MKISPVPLDVPVKVGCRYIRDLLNTVHLQIEHSATFPTDKMIVGRGIRIKMIRPVAHIQAINFTSVSEKREIAVHGAQADVRILLAHIPISICIQTIPAAIPC